uniref:Pseudouridylate synthase n=1 Tax=uncultured bacterium contig00014 TaxID=1181505 RepID=A0A806K0T1_9BACT|nr:pseudouridylate synthase [uncultured bacterium contig00014]
MEKSLKVLFENDFCLVLNKPAGLPVQGGEGVRISLDSILSETISPRPLLVHRLDRDTSGLILVAKTKEAARILSVLFAGEVTKCLTKGLGKKDRAVIKRYLGVCSGKPDPEQGVIRLDLDVRGKKAPRESETFYRLISVGNSGGVSLGDSFSFLELELGTGRTHQIRRHLAHAGHPILGDDKYGDFSLNKHLRKTLGLKHLLLHASRLIIPPLAALPDGLDVTAPLPDYFSRALELLGCGDFGE